MDTHLLPTPTWLCTGRDRRGAIRDKYYVRGVTAYRVSRHAKNLAAGFGRGGLYWSARMVNLHDTEITWDQWTAHLLSDFSGLAGGQGLKQQVVDELIAYRDQCAAEDHSERMADLNRIGQPTLF